MHGARTHVELGLESVLDSSRPCQGQETGSCEHDHESSVCVKCGKFLD